MFDSTFTVPQVTTQVADGKGELSERGDTLNVLEQTASIFVSNHCDHGLEQNVPLIHFAIVQSISSLESLP